MTMTALAHSQRAFSALSPAQAERPAILLLTSSLLTDRTYLYTELLACLSRFSQVKIWATSMQNPRYQDAWEQASATVEAFPQVAPFREVPHNSLRRLNEFVWDYRLQPPSRLSMMQHVRSRQKNIYQRTLRPVARVLAWVKTEKWLENNLEHYLLAYPRSTEAVARLRAKLPAVLLTTGPFQYEQPAIVAAAKNLGIPTLALIPSWDNISTKNRMVFKYDGFIVWSEQGRRDLHNFYPYTKKIPVYVTGASQFDVFSQARFRQTREQFCAGQGLRPDLPIIVYALGSPNFLQEQHGALALAERVAQGALGAVQMLVRPHPIHDNTELGRFFERFAPHVILQQTAEAGTELIARSQDERQIVEWVNTFRHADVVVNLSSTVTVDAALCGRPVVNLDFDPQPGQRDQQLVKDINHRWTHFKPVAESGGVWLVNNLDEMVAAVKTYLQQPDLHQEARRWIVNHVCGYADGHCGARMADAILDFTREMQRRKQV